MTAWTVVVTFSKAVTAVTSSLADITGSGRVWTLKNKSYDGNLPAGTTFELKFFTKQSSGGFPGFEGIDFNGEDICEGDGPITTLPPDTTCSSIVDSMDNGDDRQERI